MLRDIRNNYQKYTLEESTIPETPIHLFKLWLDEAIHNKVNEPTAMVLATTVNDEPDTRIVLLKEVSNDQFLFYTNYKSTKAKQIAENNHVAINFFWAELERQVRIKGIISKTDDNLSEDYFNSRPRDSQLGAWTSAQSEIIKSRDELEQKFRDTTAQFEGLSIPKPPNWGGYQVNPTEIEFWQGRPGRLHDRIRYYKIDSNQWEYKRLSP
ncbi:pyridoxamine 5'-phosphate oxidase [Sunxiuqinia indica]|uniref:pyridoxamine 5'-phosphate oxidase n=1 Tax=Sunxiuqinia indica TaxID=2692584 RepID=UPI0013598B3E|nr:pyridoxamine 5'-phosphate oxidase [Sunxiuqinia indica]